MNKPQPSMFLLSMVAIALVLTGCGSSPKPKPVMLGGVALSAPGTKVAFGQSATVASEAKAGATSALSITVKSVKVVSPVVLARYGVAAMKPAVTPYFVYVDVKNVGTTDVGGTAVPLYLQDSKDVLVNFSPINGIFSTCPSRALPKAFGRGSSQSTCLIYLLPKGDAATLVSYRPIQTVEPITWSGSIAGQASPSATPSK
ncbi:MAG: hypothetical protein NVSMB48_07180 [Marmoricola sp.]